MIIRATNKLLNTSGIKALRNLDDPIEQMPGEWYASTVSLLRPGKVAIHLLHFPTYISILIPGKSISKFFPLLSERVSNLLMRQGYSEVDHLFDLHSSPVFYTTNSRSMLGYLNILKNDMQYHISDAESVDSIDYDKLEDINFEYIFGIKGKSGKYITPAKILSNLSIKNKNI